MKQSPIESVGMLLMFGLAFVSVLMVLLAMVAKMMGATL
jgi:hypothetical protein